MYNPLCLETQSKFTNVFLGMTITCILKYSNQEYIQNESILQMQVKGTLTRNL